VEDGSRAASTPEAPPRKLLSAVRVIDKLADWSGNLFAWLIIPMVFGLTYEVFARYLFNAPTVWAYDITYMLYGGHFMLGAGYALLKGAHIRTDIFYQNWSPRTQGIVDAASYLFLFFPGMIFFFVSGTNEAVHAWRILERSDASPWRPPLYPFKTVIPFATLLLLIQGVSETIKSLYAARRGKWL
jgi:TRAP-type mannitol/chloroaromatic compound transport system permease small subunit